MTLQQKIDSNEEKLSQYKSFVDTIDLLMKNKDDQKSIEFLLEIQRLEFSGRIERGEKEQSNLRKQREAEFEAQSAEANLKLEGLIREISKFIGKDPVSITGKIQPIVEAYEKEKSDYTQWQRNAVYFELKGHFDFLTKTYKHK